MSKAHIKKQRASNTIVKNITTVGISHEGRGITHVDGKIAFIQDALANENIDYEILREKKEYTEGKLTALHNASHDRVVPACTHYAYCGGCSLQHMRSDAQVQFKQQMLMELLEKIGRCAPTVILPPITGPVQHYRNKARLSVRFVRGKGGHLVGFREKNNGRYIADISSCEILHKKVGQHLLALRELLSQFEQPDCIAQIEIAAGDEEVALIFRNLTDLRESEEILLKNFAQTSGFRVYLQPGGYDSIFMLHPEKNNDLLCYSLSDHGIKFWFHPADFTQVNAEINQKMVNQALELLQLDEDDSVMDLFCGLGNFSLPMATRCKHVIGMEGSSMMVERAQMNAKHNELSNTEFYIRDLFAENCLHKKEIQMVNKMLIDPPRSGAYEVVKQLKNSSITHLLYVSCNPATLARDADILVHQAGYRLQSAGVMDMFPHTAHVESMALFERV